MGNKGSTPSSSSQVTSKNFKWLSQQYKLKDEALTTQITSILGSTNYLNYHEKHHEHALCEWMSKLFHDTLKYNRLDISKLTLSSFEKIFQKFDRPKNSYVTNECKEIVVKLLNAVIPLFIEKNKITLKELTFFNLDLCGIFPGDGFEIFHALDRFHLLHLIEELDVSVNNFEKVDESCLIKMSNNGTSKLKRLTFSGNSLQDLNVNESNIEKITFPNLTSLYLHNNINLNSFPKWVCYQQSVHTLKMYECQIEGLIPKELFIHMRELLTLDLARNAIEGFEDLSFEEEHSSSLRNLKIKELNLHSNKISVLPSSIFNASVLSCLQDLFLSHNSITEIPDSIGDLPLLKSLILDNNHISQIPYSISKLKHLTELDLNHNRISEFPDALLELESLHSLDISSNLLNTIPLDVSKWSKLASLNTLSLACNRIKELPKNWISDKCLCNLQKLNCGFNQIPSFDIFESWPSCKLTQLILSGNRICEIPENFIETVKNKLRVFLCYNSIHETFEQVLPRLFSNTTLQYLDLEGNYLEFNPEKEGGESNTVNNTSDSHSSLNDYMNRKIAELRPKDDNNFKELKILPQFPWIQNEECNKISPHLFSWNNTSQLSYCNGTFRPDMEDAHLIEEGQVVKISDQLECSFSVYGIFDGHAGNNVSEWMAQHFTSICKYSLKNVLYDWNSNTTAHELEDEILQILKKWMAQSLILADETCREKNSHLFKDGCTAVVFALLTLSCCPNQRFAIFGNVGDARAIMGTVFLSKEEQDPMKHHDLNIHSSLENHNSQNDYLIEFELNRMTHDHKPTGDPSEILRIRNCGGYVINSRTMGTYGVARALGDWESRPFLSNEPYVNGCVLEQYVDSLQDDDTINQPLKWFNHSIESNETMNNSPCTNINSTTNTIEKQIVILGCDGVWDVLSDQDAFEMAAMTAYSNWNHHNVKSNHENSNKVSCVIRDFAHSAGSTDNISAMVIWL
ncbi:hypothetical protein C9374_010272 [Naegleria lovaniensis]|uniref:PPM-type phosphatase domain-containing protein n=1 Tax=Naegleria lovaniensis TaxID=51637 RepID=A0AA88KEC5_NAELO|nr:uncharacterized protein C9374_010272 [Naegleria lovaniensis]KAG2374898.1 hypothetical protein C9374_010272 [Naegleria lovaniensis]